MNRKLRTLGLALVAALALSAVAAATSSAWFTWEPENENPKATAKAINNQVFQFGKAKVTCETIAFDEGKVFTGEITATPTYGGCVYTEGGTSLAAHIEFTTCSYSFHTDSKLAIECPKGVEAHIKVTLLGVKRTCLTIPAQEPTHPTVDYFNEGQGKAMDVRILPTVEGIEYTKEGVCGTGVVNDGTYTGEITATADDALGAQVPLTWDEH